MLHLAVQECAASVLPLLGVAERWSGWRIIAVAFCVKRKSKQPRMRRLACMWFDGENLFCAIPLNRTDGAGERRCCAFRSQTVSCLASLSASRLLPFHRLIGFVAHIP